MDDQTIFIVLEIWLHHLSGLSLLLLDLVGNWGSWKGERDYGEQIKLKRIRQRRAQHCNGLG